MISDKKFNSSFKNTKITQIVAFDSKYDFNPDIEELKEKLKETRYFSDGSVNYRSFSKDLYDSEYAKNNLEKILVIETKINLRKILIHSETILNRKIKENLEEDDRRKDFNSCKIIIRDFCINSIPISLSFDSCGIHSIRIDFDLKTIKTPELIKMVNSTCFLIDRLFFDCLKEDLQNNDIIKEDLLSEPMTYSVISSRDADIKCSLIKREIVGISWKNENYEDLDEQLFKDIISNDIPVYDKDILTITTQAVLMVFFGVEDDAYFTERINAIEIFWRQKLLLKKMHFQLDKLIKDVDNLRKKNNIESAIELIEFIQISIQSELEVYRNTIISVTHSYSMLFETLNKVFKMNSHYDFVQEKLETCKSIYEGLNDDRRNNLMENIQWIVIVIGIATVLLPLLTDVIYGPTLGSNQTWNVIIIIGLVLFGGLGIIFRSKI